MIIESLEFELKDMHYDVIMTDLDSDSDSDSIFYLSLTTFIII